MKRIFLLILLCFLLPAHAYSSPLKDKWKADFKKLEKEKNEKLAPLLQKITENRIFNLMFTTENSIPQLRILVEALSDCILIRKGFIEQASKIGDNSFQSNKFNIMNAEKTALDTDSYNRDVYKIRLDDLEFPFLIETSYAMAQQAISLYETAISNSDTLPDRFGADIQNAYKLIEEAYNRLNRAKIIAKKKNAPYNSPEEWRAFIQNIDNIADYKNDLSSILEQINQLPAKLRETLDGLVKITDSIDLGHLSLIQFEAVQRSMLALVRELDELALISPAERQSIMDKMAGWENAFQKNNANDPLITSENTSFDREERSRQLFLLLSQQEVNDRLLYIAHVPAVFDSKSVFPVDLCYAEDEYCIPAGLFYRFFMVGKSSDTVLKVAVLENGQVIYEERLPLPRQGSLEWSLNSSEEAMLWIPRTSLQSLFGLEFRLRFLPGGRDVSNLMLSVKGKASTYSYAISFEERTPLFNFKFAPPPPWQFDAISKPEQSKTLSPLQKVSSFTETILEKSSGQNINASSPLIAGFVKDLGNNPIAIAQFVQNEIDIFDPFLHCVGDCFLAPSIYRGPEETLISREGSPWEQCLLLTALLREAGHEAVCVEGEPHTLPCEFAERMLFTYAPGAEYVQVKYPWVLFKNGEEWISLFPWIKDIRVTEGYDPYALFPDAYASGDLWIRKYLCNDSEIMKHIGPEGNDTVGVLFVRFLEEQLAKSSFTMKDIGIHRAIRKRQYSSWGDFPRPTIIGRRTSIPDFAKRNDLFEEFKVVISSNRDPEHKQIATDPIRFSDLKGRSFGISFSPSENGKHILHFTLPGEWEKPLTLDPSDHGLTVQVSFGKQFHSANQLGTPASTTTFSIVKGTCAALCFQPGHCNQKAVALQGKAMEGISSENEKLHAILAYVGAAYFEKCGRAERLLSSLHHMPSSLQLSLGLAKLSPDTSHGPITGEPVLVFPQVDMHWLCNVAPGGSRYQDPDSMETQLHTLLIADISSNEHQVLHDIFHDPYAISTVKLLQIAHKKHQEGGGTGPGFLVFTEKSFADAETLPELARIFHFSHLPEISLRKIRVQGMSQWNTLHHFFSEQIPENVGVNKYKYDTYAYMTPGPIASLDGELGIPSYTGMGTLIIHPGKSSALISDGTNHLNGGYGSWLNQDFLWEMKQESWVPDRTISDFSLITPPFKVGSTSLPNLDQGILPTFTPETRVDPDKWDYYTFETEILLSEYAYKSDVRPEHKSYLNTVADPVDVVTGAFYVDEIDLTLPGTFPLVIRRNYNNQNPCPSILGYGWKLGFDPQIHEEEDKLFASEEDGTVIVYRLKPESARWEVNPEDNPNLNNCNSKGIGGIANPYHAYIVKDEGYILHGTDGSKRTYVDGKLIKWEDHRRNILAFLYKNDQLSRIENMTGGFIGFYYDHGNRICEAYSSDGRRVIYNYSPKGNLAEVIMPNGGVVEYRYDGVHQIIRETKPHGKILENVYLNGKVIEQHSPVGPQQSMTVSASFSYEPDKTVVTDGEGYKTEYSIWKKQIYRVVDPAGNKILHSWFIDSTSWFDAEEGSVKAWEGTGAWPKSLKSSVDQRGLTTEYRYDDRGNTNEITLSGTDLTGNGVTDVVKQQQYNDRNLLIKETVADRAMTITYDEDFHYLAKTQESYIAGQLMHARNLTYYPSGLLKTDEDEGAICEWEYTPKGFPKKMTRKTSTADPDVITEFDYNFQGQCIKVIATDSMTTFSYDIMGNKESETVYSPSGIVLSDTLYDYNLNGQLIFEEGLEQHKTTIYDYNANGELKASKKVLSDVVVDENGDFRLVKSGSAYTRFDYDTRGSKILETDSHEYSTELKYDPLARVSSVTRNGLETTYSYEAGGLISTVEGPDGGLSKRSYTTNGLLINEERPDGTESTYIYDLFGRPIVETLSGIIWDIIYDDKERKVIRTHRLTGYAEIREFDSRGNEINFTDAAGYAWTKKYDALDRLILETDPEGMETILSYSGDVVTRTLPNGEKLEHRYEAGQVVESKAYSKDGTLITYSTRHYYPLESRLEERSGDYVTNTWFNTMGQPLLVFDGIGKTLHHYDSCGNLIESIDAVGLTTRFKYDPLNRLSKKTLPDGAIVTYGYDAGSNLSSVIFPNGAEWIATYDTMGRKRLEEVRSKGSIINHWDFSYENGLLKTTTDPLGKVHVYTYDLFNRLEEGTVQGFKRTFNYDPRGFVAHAEQMCGDHTIVNRVYDSCGRLATETTSLNGETVQDSIQSWTPESMTLTLDGYQSHRVYEGGRLKELDSQGLHYTYDHDLSGRLHQTQSPFGKRKWFFQPDGLPDQCQYEGRNGTIEELMQREENGKIKNYTSSGAHTSIAKEIGYDNRGRMKTVENALFIFDFDSPGIGTCTTFPGYEIPSDGLDPFGNVLIEQIEGILTLNQYDDAGQLTYRETEDKYEKLSWDPWGRLTSVETETDTWKAAYDPFGRRLRTTHTSNNDTPIITTSLYDPSAEFLEIGVKINGKTFWKVHGSTGLEAIVDEAGNAVGLIHDALGNLIGISTNEEEIWNEELPSPYGARGPPSPQYESAIEFAQAHAWRDLRPDPSGYLWMGARYYNTHSGRFLSPDPIGYPITLNLYTYANGDPINFHDPDGRFASAVYQTARGNVLDFHNQLSAGMINGISSRQGDVLAPHGMSNIAYDLGYFIGGIEKGYNAIHALTSLPPDPTRVVADVPLPGRGGKCRITPIRSRPTSQITTTDTISSLEIRSSEVTLRSNVTEATQPYTRSNLKLGQQMHNDYKLSAPGRKEYTLPSGRRIDFLDIDNEIIYELKPNNPRAIKEGLRQLQYYLDELKTVPKFADQEWKMILETY